MTEATLSMVLKLLFNYNKLFTTNKNTNTTPTETNSGEMTKLNELLGNDATDNKQITEVGRGRNANNENIYIKFLNTVYELYGVSALDQYPFYHNTQFLIHSYCFIVAEYYSSIINNANANEDLTAALTPLSDINKLLLRITPYTITTQTYIRQPSSNNT
jgi:hypothetical protein